MKVFKFSLACFVLMVVVLAFSFQANADLTTGLVAYFPFSGNANDLSGSGHHGTVYGASLSQDRFGNANSAYSFDGYNDYISFSHHTDFNINTSTGFTVFGWFNASSTQNETSGLYDIIDKWHGGPPGNYTSWTVQLSPTYVRTDIGNGVTGWSALAKNSDFRDNEWHSFATTVSGSDMWFYVDGELAGTRTHSGVASNTGNLLIGRHWYYSRYFTGAIDDVRIYNRALAGSEVQQLSVVPEPISSTLFIVGGATLGFRRFRNKFKK